MDLPKFSILAIIITILLGSYLSYITSSNFTNSLLLFALAGIASLFYTYLITMHTESIASSERKQSLIDGLHEIAYHEDKKHPLISSIVHASSAYDSYLYNPFIELSRRIRFGAEISDAFDVAASRILHKKFDWFGAHITSSSNSIQNFLDVYEGEMQRDSARSGPRIQTSATISMFISTILPSFIIFAFIGSAVISNNGMSLFTISVLMLIAIPAAYATMSVMQHGHIFKD